MLLPDAASIRKRARDETPPTAIDTLFYRIVTIIGTTVAEDLCDGDGVGINVTNVPHFEAYTAHERQCAFGRVAKQSGYVVTVAFKTDCDWKDVPAHVWDWDDFHTTTYDSLLNVWIRVDEEA